MIAKQIARRTDLRAVHLDDLTTHYTETLRRWRANFDAATDQLDALGYDERFRRLWRLYLGYCEAGFAERRIGLIQTRVRQAAGAARRARRARRGYVRGCRLNIRPLIASSQEGGAARGELGDRRAARRARRCRLSSSTASSTFSAHSPGSTLSHPDVSM